jgi:phage gp36-like protein
MPYASRQDLECAAGGADRLTELADWNRDGVADDDAIEKAQAKAEGLIDSYAALRYAVPIAAPSQVMIQHAAEETIFQLKLRRGMVTQADADERVVRLEWLDRLSQGKVRPSDPAPPKSSAVRNGYKASQRAVSRRKLRGFW